MKSKTIAAALCIALLASTRFADAQDEGRQGSVALSFGVGHTDNIERNADAVSATYRDVSLAVNVGRQRQRVQGALNGTLTHSDYSSSEVEIDTPLAGNLAGSVAFTIVPRRFDWVASDTFGTVRNNFLSAPSPANREYLNVIETGPNVFLPLGGRTTLNLQGRYQETRRQRSENLDSEAVTSGIGVSRTLSRTQRVGVSATKERVEFDAEGVVPFTVESVFGSYDRELAAGALSLNAGKTSIQYAGVESDGPLLRFSWNKPLTARSVLTVSGGREFQSSADQFSESGIRLRDDGYSIQTTDPRTTTRFGLEYSVGRDRARLSWALSTAQDRQEIEVLLDRDIKIVSFNLGLPLGPDWTLGGGISYSEEDFVAVETQAEERLVNLGFSRRLGRDFSVSIRYDRFHWESTLGETEPENRLLLSLVWELR